MTSGLKFWLLVLAASLLHAAYAAPPKRADALDEQREQYRAARAALSRGEVKTFRRLTGGLSEYPLYPYLEYAELRRRIGTLPQRDVEAFLGRYGDDLLGVRLRNAWLDTLAAKQRWPDYLRYSTDATSSTPERRCERAWAMLKSGETARAMEEATRIWLSPRSLPKVCDRLFSTWIERGNPDADVAWRRFHLAVSADQQQLARYLLRFLDPAQRKDAELCLAIRERPSLVGERARFARENPRASQVVEYGLSRLAAQDAAAARALFSTYAREGYLTEEAQRLLSRRIASGLARTSNSTALEWAMGLEAAIRSEELSEDMVRYAMRDGEWERITEVLHLIPEPLRQQSRWRYWTSRGLEATGTSANAAEVRRQYEALGAERSYYGFLAADRIGVGYSMQHEPVPVGARELDRIARHPGIRRARELWLIGEQLDSRREWFHTLPRLNDRERVAAGKLAATWGWHPLSIGALIAAEDWNDLELRFPLAYDEAFSRASRQTRIDDTLLYAVARQESAFNATIRSPAGALGLMQLMPATARETARRAGIPYQGTQDLLNPSTNVTLGSRYMRSMLDDFQQNRILAAAAYNAGPARVRRWLRNMPAEVEHDLFVETIPFRETRQYVQNVLSFAVIYAYLQGRSTVLVLPEEKRIVNPYRERSTG